MMPKLNELLSDPCNTFVEKAIERGEIPVGYTCSYVPDVMLMVKGLFPLRMRAPGVAGTEMADSYLSSVICSYCRSLLEFAMEGRYDFLKGWVFTASCDHLRRLYDNLAYLEERPFLHILDLPHKTSKAALDWYEDELRKLAIELNRQFGVCVDEETLTEAVERRNRISFFLRKAGEERKKKDVFLKGSDFHRLMLLSRTVPADDFLPLIEKFLQDCKGGGEVHTGRARILVAGGQLDDPAYLEVIESQGGLVVADRFCTGSLPGAGDIELKEDPFRCVAKYYLEKMQCPRMMENFPFRLDEILKDIDDYHADGVILQTVKFCDTWGVESSPLVSALRERGIPVLRLEREYRHSGEGQLKTRVQAFIESMGK